MTNPFRYVRHAALNRVALTSEIWAITPEKLAELVDLVSLEAEDDLAARITKQQEHAVARQEGAVAVLPLHDVITNRASFFDLFGGTSSETFGRVFKQAVASPDVKAIVLDVNSPGGTVSGTDELSSLIHSARGTKPIIAHVDSMAASAAYWIASAADEMIMTPSGAVGSIGVLAAHDDVSGLLANFGVKRTLISAGKYKTSGNPFEPLSDEAREHLQSRVDASHQTFIKAIARNRGTSHKAVAESYGQGRLVEAPQAIALGMVDGVGTMASVLQRFGATTPARDKRRAFAFEREKRALAL